MRDKWLVKKLSELCIFQRGLTYSKSDEVESSDNVVLRATNVDVTTNLLNFSELRYISNSVQIPPGKRVRKDSLLVCTASGSKSHLGKIAYIDDNYGYAFGGFMGMLTPTNGIHPRYLFHLLTSEAYKEFIDALSDGANINNLKFDQLARFEVPYPPLAEQRRIVGILDQAFAAIATAKANTEKNIQNARDVFASELNAVFADAGPDWVALHLKSVTTKIGSGATPRGGEQSYKASGIPLIRSLNVHDLGFRYLKLAYLDTAQASELNNVIVQAGDVLLNITGASIARCCVVPPDVLPARVNQHVMIIRPMPERLDSEFLHYALISEPYKDHLLRTGEDAGATRQALTKPQVEQFSVRCPATLEAQKCIVSTLDAIRAKTTVLESVHQKKLAALDALKKSLLQQAFSGQLAGGAFK